MVTVRLLTDSFGLNGFKIEGHCTTDYTDTEGKLVCAAVSSAALMAANTVTEIAGNKAQASAQDGEMLLKAKMPDEVSAAVLAGFKLHIEQLSKQYPKRIRIITEV